MIIDKKKIKLFSTIGSRATFGMASLEIAKENSELMILTCDVSTSAGLDRFRKIHPNQYLDLGIAEQNMIGVATGLASEGYDVITTTFAPFQTIRCCEQIKVNLGYMKHKICMVGLASGISLGTLGFTHCCIEDVGILRSIPNINIISPADSLETVKALEASISSNSSCYLRLTGVSNNPIVYKEDYEFSIGRSIKIVEGDDITIFATGTMVAESVKASEVLNKKNIYVNIVNMHTIKPIDKEAIYQSCKKSKLIISIEEHNTIGGLGSAISEVVSGIINSPKLLMIGIEDYYSSGGEYNFLKEKYGLTYEKIVDKIEKNL